MQGLVVSADKAPKALAELRALVPAGLHNHHQAWKLVREATSALPADPRVDELCGKIVDLLSAIEIETILGGDRRIHERQVTALLDWIEKHG